MTIGKRIISNSGYLYARMAVTMFVSLYTTRLILSALGESEFGIYNVVGGAIGMLGFLNAAMASATQRFMSYTEGSGNISKVKIIFNVSIVLHAIVSAICLIVFSIVGLFLFEGVLNIPPENIHSAKIVYFCMVISTAFTVLSVPYDAVLNAHENMRYYALIGLLDSVLKFAVALIICNATDNRLILYGILMALIPIITLSIMRIYCHEKYIECEIKIKKYWDAKILREISTFAGWNIFQIGSAMITNSGMGIIINVFFGTILNAAQGISTTICGQLMALTNVMTKAINPIITKTEGGNDREKTIILAVTTTKGMYCITALLGIPAIITMSEILDVWLTNIPPFAVFFAQCQVAIALCEQMTSGITTAITATGKIRKFSTWKSVFKLSVLPISSVLFMLGHSVIMAYIFLVILQGVINGVIITVICSERILGYKIIDYLRHVGLPLVSSTLIIFLVGFFLKIVLPFGIYNFFVVFAVCISVSLLVFFKIAFTKWEQDRILSACRYIRNLVIK